MTQDMTLDEFEAAIPDLEFKFEKSKTGKKVYLNRPHGAHGRVSFCISTAEGAPPVLMAPFGVSPPYEERDDADLDIDLQGKDMRKLVIRDPNVKRVLDLFYERLIQEATDNAVTWGLLGENVKPELHEALVRETIPPILSYNDALMEWQLNTVKVKNQNHPRGPPTKVYVLQPPVSGKENEVRMSEGSLKDVGSRCEIDQGLYEASVWLMDKRAGMTLTSTQLTVHPCLGTREVGRAPDISRFHMHPGKIAVLVPREVLNDSPLTEPEAKRSKLDDSPGPEDPARYF